MPAISQFFYIVAFGSSLVMVIMLLMNLIGLSHADADLGGGGQGLSAAAGPHLLDHDTGLSWLSIRTLLAFLVGFGWGGVALFDATTSISVTIIGSTVIGAAFMFIVFWLMNAIYRLRDSGNIDYANAIGKVATVYVTIPPRREGTGQVQVMVQGRLREVAAVADCEERLAPGSKVLILKQLDAATFVVQLERSE